MFYEKYNFIKPPRAETKIPPALLSFYEERGYVAQYKKNGTNSIIFVSPEKELIVKTRHNADHKAWRFTEASAHVFKALPGKGWYVINAELLHSKTPAVKDTHYIHDIFVNDGEYLVGVPYSERYRQLYNLFSDVIVRDSHFVIDDNTWLARCIVKGFAKTFASMNKQEDEGLVLKRPNGLLSRTDWLVKCRKSHENYSF